VRDSGEDEPGYGFHHSQRAFRAYAHVSGTSLLGSSIPVVSVTVQSARRPSCPVEPRMHRCSRRNMRDIAAHQSDGRKSNRLRLALQSVSLKTSRRSATAPSCAALSRGCVEYLEETDEIKSAQWRRRDALGRCGRQTGVVALGPDIERLGSEAGLMQHGCQGHTGPLTGAKDHPFLGARGSSRGL
jgi:hypothetical protein